MKANKDYKHIIAIGFTIIVAAVAITTVLQQDNKLRTSLRNFSQEVATANTANYEQNVAAITEKFLKSENIKPIVGFSTSSASQPSQQQTADIPQDCVTRAMGELYLWRLKQLATPGTAYPGALYTYPCQAYSIPSANAYNTTYGPKAPHPIAYSGSNQQYAIASGEDCTDLVVAIAEGERLVNTYAYGKKPDAKTQALLDSVGHKSARGYSTIKSDSEASAILKDTYAMNQAFEKSCVKKN